MLGAEAPGLLIRSVRCEHSSVSSDGSVYGEHTLARDHANEQPFTRTQSGVEIPNEVDEVTVEERDSKHGYGGTTVTVPMPDREAGRQLAIERG